MRGYFGIAVWQPKSEANFGGILRNAHAFGAAFVALIAHRYVKEPTNTTRAELHLPLYVYETLEEFVASRPHDCEIVRVEVDGAKSLPEFTHLDRACYLFGGEDRTLPKLIGERSVRMDTQACLNLATATGIVMYDRLSKQRPSAPGWWARRDVVSPATVLR